jgi:hypothetical protein
LNEIRLEMTRNDYVWMYRHRSGHRRWCLGWRRRHRTLRVVDEIGRLLGAYGVANTCRTNGGVPRVTARTEIVRSARLARAEATLELARNTAVGLGIARLTVARKGATIARIHAGTNRIVVPHLTVAVIERSANNVARTARVWTPRWIVVTNGVRIDANRLVIQTCGMSGEVRE